MKSIPLIRAGILLPIVDFLDDIGSPTDRLLEQVNLSHTAFDDPDRLLTFYQAADLIERAANLEGLEAFGFLVGRQTPPLKLGTLGKVLQNSLTLFDLLATIEQVVGMANSSQQVNLRWDGDWVWWQFCCDQTDQASHLQSHRYDLGLYLTALRQVLGPAWRPTELHLKGPPCRAILAIDDFAGTTIHFLRPYNAIKIPRAALSLPYNPWASGTGLNDQPDYDRFQQTAPAQTFFDSLQQLIQAQLPYGSPDITLVAAASGLSVRSLQRHLTEAGLPYSKLVDQVRFNRAVALLQQSDVKLLEIAAELGYTDPANFARAFRRWAGISPRQYRLLHSQAGGRQVFYANT
jgi:AraC-like DNA-binding protein